MSIDGILLIDMLNEKLLLVRKNMSTTATLASYTDLQLQQFLPQQQQPLSSQFQQQPVILNISENLTPFSLYKYHNQLNQQMENAKECSFMHNFQQQRIFGPKSSSSNSGGSMTTGNPNFHQNATHLYWAKQIFSFIGSQTYYKEQKMEVFRRLANQLVTKKSAPEAANEKDNSAGPTYSYLTLKKTDTKLTNIDSKNSAGASGNLASSSSTSGISVVGADRTGMGSAGSNVTEPIDFDNLVINALSNELSDFHVYDFQNGRIIVTTEVNGILYAVVANKENANEFAVSKLLSVVLSGSQLICRGKVPDNDTIIANYGKICCFVNEILFSGLSFMSKKTDSYENATTIV